MRTLCRLLSILFLLLLFSSFVTIVSGSYPNNTNISNVRVYEDMDYSSVESIVDSLMDENMSKRERAFTLYEFVKDSMYHKKGVKKDVWDDWVAFIISESGIYPPAKKVVDPLELLTEHRSGLCGQHAYVLYALAKKAELDARIWGLKGHIVTDIYYNGGWHVFDSDQEVIYYNEEGEVANLSYLEEHPVVVEKKLIQKGWPEDSSKRISNVYSTRNNEVVTDTFKRVKALQYVTSLSNYIIPTMIAGIFIYLRFKRLNTKR